MVQYSFTAQGKKSTEDVEAANTAAQQNKNNTKATVDPKVLIRNIKLSKGEVMKSFCCFLCMFLLITIVMGALVTFVQLNFICQSITEISAFSGDSSTASDSELSKTIEQQQKKYEELQKSHDSLKHKYEQILSEHMELNTRFMNCENSNFAAMSSLQAAFYDFIRKKCDLTEGELELTTLRPEHPNFFEVIDFNPNEPNSEKLTLHTQMQTILTSGSSETTQNLNENLNGQQTEE